MDYNGYWSPTFWAQRDEGDHSASGIQAEDVDIGPLPTDQTDEMIQLIRDNLKSYQEAGTVLASMQRRLDQFQSIYQAPGAVFLAVTNRDTGELIGGAGLGPFAGLSHAEKIGEIRELVIAPSHRGQGFGARLLQSCLTWARKFGYERLYLETTPQMQHAQKLFQRFDFKPVTLKQKTAPGSTEAPTNPPQVPCYYMLDQLD
jgi:putative acetyltransferase